MRTRSHSSNPARRHARGAITVEFAIVAVAMLLLIAGIIGFGRAFWYTNALTKSVRDGARLLSNWPVDTIGSSGVAEAKKITILDASAANVSPSLTDANVVVQCLDASFGVVACANDTVPANVRVGITGFSLNLGEWFPFISTNDFGDVGLAPHVTMRYMK